MSGELRLAIERLRDMHQLDCVCIERVVDALTPADTHSLARAIELMRDVMPGAVDFCAWCGGADEPNATGNWDHKPDCEGWKFVSGYSATAETSPHVSREKP